MLLLMAASCCFCCCCLLVAALPCFCCCWCQWHSAFLVTAGSFMLLLFGGDGGDSSLPLFLLLLMAALCFFCVCCYWWLSCIFRFSEFRSRVRKWKLIGIGIMFLLPLLSSCFCCRRCCYVIVAILLLLSLPCLCLFLSSLTQKWIWLFDIDLVPGSRILVKILKMNPMVGVLDLLAGSEISCKKLISTNYFTLK